MKTKNHPLDNCPRCGNKTIWPNELPEGLGTLFCPRCDWKAVEVMTPEQNVIERAKEWYEAKKQAEENAGQPVNWADYNLNRLEEATKSLIEQTATPTSLR